METLNATDVTGRQIVQSLSEPVIEGDSGNEDEVINSTSSMEYNTESSSNCGTDSDDNESDSIQMLLKTVDQICYGRKAGRFILIAICWSTTSSCTGCCSLVIL